jgi:hypothetical protein
MSTNPDPPDDPPPGIPAWAWCAAHNLYSEMERIDGEAGLDGQISQDPDAEHFAWCHMVAEIIVWFGPRTGP